MASRVDLKGIKDNIKSILDAANLTTTASPVYLSQDMTTKVQKVLTIHPEKIPMQASIFPCVTCHVIEKSKTSSDIAKDQLSIKRKSEITIEVIGFVFNQNYKVFTEDPADNDINYLMENIELALRGNENLNTKVTWQDFASTKYYSIQLEEETHMRAGILTLNGIVFY